MSLYSSEDESGERAADAEPRSLTPARRGPAPVSVEEPGFFDSLVAFLRPRVPPSLREEFVAALSTREEPAETGFTPGERLMLTNILQLHDVRVEDIMVPRTEIQAVPATATLAEVMARFEDSGHSRMPVYGEGLDDLLGMIHIRDMVGHITRAALCYRRENGSNGETGAMRSRFDLARVDLDPTISDLGLLREVLFVPPSMHAAELMARMQASRIQMALVIDEYGGTDGLVSLEDILEMVVGNIEDEHDEEERLVENAGEGVYHADARADFDEIRRVIGADFDPGLHAEDADTVGGLVVNALGRVPVAGEVVEAVAGFEIEVTEADARRVRRLRIVRVSPDGNAVSAPVS